MKSVLAKLESKLGLFRKQDRESEQMSESVGEQVFEENSDGANAPAAPEASERAMTTDDLKSDIVAVLKTVYDPEIPVDIYELGLIYEVEVDDARVARLVMTLTSPMCPVAETLPPEVEAKVRSVSGVSDVQLELVWEPAWSMDMMSEAARLELNL